jgi:hypothetical protein
MRRILCIRRLYREGPYVLLCSVKYKKFPPAPSSHYTGRDIPVPKEPSSLKDVDITVFSTGTLLFAGVMCMVMSK